MTKIYASNGYDLPNPKRWNNQNRKRHVQITGLFAEWKIIATMHTGGEHRRIIGTGSRRSIALVDIEVEHQDRPGQSLPDHRPGCHREIVQDAESAAECRVGVVRTAGGVHGESVFHRQSRRENGASDGAERAPDESGRPGQANPSLRSRIDASGRGTAERSASMVRGRGSLCPGPDLTATERRFPKPGPAWRPADLACDCLCTPGT